MTVQAVPRRDITPMPAVVLVNLGTPEAPHARAVRPYLREFLSDRRVVEMHPALWRPILEGIILRFRPKASAEKYASIWTEQGSPLLVHTRAQTAALSADLGGAASVRLAMRYGSPALSDVLDEVYADGHRRVLVVPLYPQYAASSAGTVLDEVYRWGLRSRDQLELRTVRSFPVDEGYLSALATAVERHWEAIGKPDFSGGDRLLLSFHAIPMAMHQAGDPYRAECEVTAAALRERLGLGAEMVLTTFQSVFGPAEWLKPATIDTVTQLGRSGIGRVDVLCPGFVSDCLETLEEIDILNRSAFTDAGGSQFHYIPWGNGRPEWTAALTGLVGRHLTGWVTAGKRHEHHTAGGAEQDGSPAV